MPLLVAFSLVKQNKQWLLQSTQGVDGTNLSNPVNNLLGRQVYYRLDVIKGVSSSYTYEVLGIVRSERQLMDLTMAAHLRWL